MSLCFSLQPLNETCISRITEREIINLHTYLRKDSVPLVKFQSKLNFLKEISKYTTYSFSKNLSVGRWVVPCGRMNRRTNILDEPKSRRSQICERDLNFDTK